MKASHIEELLSALGCSKIKRGGRVVHSTCPLALWTHSGGRDKNPSFAVFIEDNDTSTAGCLAANCRFHGNMNELLWRIQAKSGRDMSGLLLKVRNWDSPNFKRILDSIESKEKFGERRPTDTKKSTAAWTGGKDYSDPLIAASMAPELPESAKEHVQKMIDHLDQESLDYLHGPDRRFTDATLAKWKIGWHPGARRVSLPQYDHLGRLVNISGRYVPYWPSWVMESKAPKWMHANGFNRELYLFGEDWFQLSGDGRGTIFLTEGGFDVVYLDQCGVPNAAAINGSHINKIQIEKVLRWFDHLVLVMDGDEAGKESVRKLNKIFSPRMTVSTYVIPDGRDPNQMKDEEIDDLKRRFLS